MSRRYTRKAACRALGVSWGGMSVVITNGWLTLRQGHISHAALRRFAESPLGWLVAPPETIGDPLLRACAQTARGRLWRYQWMNTAHLAARYYTADTTVCKWRHARQWPSADAWVQWRGAWWLWLNPDELPLPPAPAPCRTRTEAQRRTAAGIQRVVGEANRRAVIAAVMRRGGVPGYGKREAVVRAVAEETGLSPTTVRRYWRDACAAD